MKTVLGTAGAVFVLTLVGGCGEGTEGPERGVTLPRGLGKADGTTSCQGVCGAQAPGGCWCDEQCAKYGDCCADKVAVCDNALPSCQDHCGDQSPDGCWCDDECAKYGDCCPDKDQVCGSELSECEQQSGYCAHFLDPCKAGHSDGPGMGCPMGKSGKCCLPQTTCTDNNDCAAEEYCHYDAGECLLETFSTLTGTCKERPTACIKLYNPVCGCDGKTYSNDCHASAGGTSVGQSGACKAP